MNNNPLISIIVPVYNVEKYLEKCIESLVNQSFKDTEILLIDDGSTDSSGMIADKYDNGVTIITFHKKNGGLSDARNYGISKARGDFITFFDSDDYASKNYIKALYDGVEKYNADIVISGLKDFYDGNPVEEDNYLNNKIIKISKEECYKKMLMQDGIDINATAKLYKREIFDDILFPVGYYYEDFEIFDLITEKANSICYITYRGYNYLQRKNSIMYGEMSEKRMSLVKKARSLIDFFDNKYPSLKKYAIKRYIKCNFHLLGRSILDSNCDHISNDLRNNILFYLDDIKKNYELYSKKEKIAIKVLKRGIKKYKLFWKIYCILKGK